MFKKYCVSTIKIFHSKRYIFLLTLLLMMAASLFTRLIPPFMSPDENVHLTRADMLAHGTFFLQLAPIESPLKIGGSGGHIDKNLFLFSLQALQLNFPGNPTPSLLAAPTLLQELHSFKELRSFGKQTPWAETEVFAPASGTGYYFPLIYTPHATVLWFSRLMGYSLITSYELVRLTIVGISMVLVVLALRLLSFPALALGIMATPMAIFQWYSPTIDGLTMGLTLYATSLFFVEIQSAQPSKSRQLLLALAVFLIVTTRTHMLPMLAFPIYLSWRQRTTFSWSVTLLAAGFSTTWIIFAIKNTIDTRVVRIHSTLDIVRIYATHPNQFLELLERTFTNSDLQTFYIESFIGRLGWLDAPIPQNNIQWLYWGLALLFVLSLPAAWTTRRNFLGVRLLLIMVSASSMLLIFTALAITWIDYPANVIQGVQGRYFILPFFIAACALWNPISDHYASHFNQKSRGWQSLANSALFIYFLYSLHVMIITLIQRYQLSFF